MYNAIKLSHMPYKVDKLYACSARHKGACESVGKNYNYIVLATVVIKSETQNKIPYIYLHINTFIRKLNLYHTSINK